MNADISETVKLYREREEAAKRQNENTVHLSDGLEGSIRKAIKKDAVEFGNALNDAGWKFNEAYQKIMGESPSGKLFNNCKAILRECIIEYIEKVKIAASQSELEQWVITEGPLESVYGSSYCKYSLLENNQARLYRNQEKIYGKLEDILSLIKKEL